MGRFGMTIDNMLECEVVTAEGEILTANANEHPDLFWALRGGGGNFGIVTSFTYRLHPLDTVLGGMLVFHQAAAPLALRVYRELTGSAPDELLAHAVFATVPNFGPALIVQAVYSGSDMAEGERVLAPLRRFGPPAIDLVAPRKYVETYMMLTPPEGPPVPFTDTCYTLRKPSDAALDEIVACAQAMPTPMALINMHQIHGAATRVAPDATAFALREPHYAVLNGSAWITGDGAAEKAWVEQSQARMAPYASSGLYVNFLGEQGDEAIRASYRANYARLAEIKARYDGENVFHRNQNIRPAR
jgi:FAD/FMN-containing dehydrogenase